jgi:hypothetical protein
MTDTTNPQADYTAAIAERAVEVRWPDNERGGATPPADDWQDRAWEQRTLHEIDESSVSGCSVLRWRDDPRTDAELIALSLALVTGQPAAVPVPASAPTDRAAILREAADALHERGKPVCVEEDGDCCWFDAVRELRRLADVVPVSGPGGAADETQQDETLADGGEAEKLAKARRMAKAFSAPPVAPPEWDATEGWPMRHKRARDRRVHATAPFLMDGIQRIWTACGKQVGRGGYPLSHMSVDCRDCQSATAPDAEQPAAVAQPDGEA